MFRKPNPLLTGKHHIKQCRNTLLWRFIIFMMYNVDVTYNVKGNCLNKISSSTLSIWWIHIWIFRDSPQCYEVIKRWSLMREVTPPPQNETLHFLWREFTADSLSPPLTRHIYMIIFLVSKATLELAGYDQLVSQWPSLDLMHVQALELGHLGVQLDNRLSKLKLFF